jgi:endonuclease/exonuclease/phosphatase family metal-dependent hydrolase
MRWPDAIKSSGGGANAILVRRGKIIEHRALRLCLLPERRWVHAVALRGTQAPQSTIWIANLHLTAHNPAAARREAARARGAILAWASGSPAVLGGDFNLPSVSLPGFETVGAHGVDHLLVSDGLQAVDDSEVLVRGLLSDHAPMTVELVPGDSRLGSD